MKYIRGFDGLRAISILFVIFTHLGLFSLIKDVPFLRKNFNLFSGSTGVMIFFTISGFLITSLLLNEKNTNGFINFKHFFIRRFLRLLPPLFVFFIILLLLMVFHFIPANYPAVLISFFYVYNFVPRGLYTAELGHTWSLAVEEQFYFIWPFVISGIKKINKALILALAIIAACVIFEMIFRIPFPFQGRDHKLTDYFYVERWFIPACLPIMTGALTSMVLFSQRPYLEKYFQKNVWLLIASFLFFTAQLFVPGLSQVVVHVCQPVGISILLLWISFNQNSSFVKALELKPISFIGKISYGLYVYQGLFLRTGPGGSLDIQQFPLNICLVVITTLLSYFLLEKGIMKYKNRFKTTDLHRA